MFTDNAELGGLLDSKEPLKVSKVVHKAFVDVNEAGTEATAATGEHSIYNFSFGFISIVVYAHSP